MMMARTRRNISERLAEQSKAVWEVMRREAERKHFARQRVKEYGDGRVIIATIGGFISALDKEREWNLEKAEKDLLRRYLKATGNVVALNKVEQYQWRIFVREEWNDAEVIPFTVVGGDDKGRGKAEQQLTPEEAGEDREPAPVRTKWQCKDCGGEFENQQSYASHVRHSHSFDLASPLSEQQAGFLCALHAAGEVHDESGHATRLLYKFDDRLEGKLSGTMRSLVDQGLVERETRHPKRTNTLRLTERGREVVEDIDTHRATTDVVRDHLARIREVHSETGDLTNVLAEQVGKSPGSVGRALRALEDEGLVDLYRTDGGYMTGVRWRGKPFRPHTMWSRSSDAAPKRVVPEKDIEAVVRDTLDEPVDRLSDRALVRELSLRLTKQDPSEELQAQNDKLIDANSDLVEKLDLIQSVVKDAAEGGTSPLKALSDIEEVMTL